MKLLRRLLPATVLVAGMLAMASGASAAPAQSAPVVTSPPAANCFTGIGARLRQTGLTASERQSRNVVTISFMKPLTVDAVMPGTPAQAAHLYPGDKIIKVNGKPVSGLTMSQAVALIIGNGAPGSTVTITIRRDGNHIQRDIKLTLGTVCSPTH